MPEHAHLLVHPQQPNYDISMIRKAIKGPVAERAIHYLENSSPEWLERITRKRGEKTERLFWQSGGGHDRNVESARTLLAEIDYIHLNPVKRGLVELAANWKWSSAGWFVESPTNSLKPDPIPSGWVA
jgi:putative transposase